MRCPYCGKEADADPRFFVHFQDPYNVLTFGGAIEHLPKDWYTLIWTRDDGSYPTEEEVRAAAKAACPAISTGASVLVYPGRVYLVSYYM
jgi:hypothetical protein